MPTALGTLEELPQEYRQNMRQAGVAPLWPALRNVLPYAKPEPVSQACLWSYQQIKPLLLQAGALTPVEKAERRVLVLSDPGRGDGAMQVSASLYGGLQLLLPGETAPSHKHTPSAARIVVEGQGAYTVVEDERLPMEEGDVILTPTGTWHEHCHEGTEPVIWLDALDLPLFHYLEGSYAIEGESQSIRNRPDNSEVDYLQAGLVPSRRNRAAPCQYPLRRFPWKRTEAALRQLATYDDAGPIEVDYVNPETGESAMPIMGFTALMLRPGEHLSLPRRSSSAMFHIVRGSGRTIINGQEFKWTAKDTFSAAIFDEIDHFAGAEEAFLLCIHDAPLQMKLGYYEERQR